MKRFLLPIMVACLALVGCRTASHPADADDEPSLREMRSELIQEMRAAGATPAQVRNLERQLEVLERQMKKMQRELEKNDKSGD